MDRCSNCDMKYDPLFLSMCSACNDPEEKYCEDCSFVDSHPCILMKRGTPSASIDPSWERDDARIWGHQCLSCLGYNHAEKACPLRYAKRDPEFRRCPRKNSSKCSKCLGFGHREEHHEQREEYIKSLQKEPKVEQSTTQSLADQLKKKSFERALVKMREGTRHCPQCCVGDHWFSECTKQHDEVLWLLSKAEKKDCLLYTSPSPRDRQKSRMPSSA